MAKNNPIIFQTPDFTIQTPDFTIQTPRLLLKDLTVADAEALFCYRSQPEVIQFQGWAPKSMDDAVRFIEKDICHEMNQPDTWFQYGIFLQEEPILIGDLGLHFLPEDGEAGDLEAGDLEAGDVEAWNLEAGDVEAWNLEAGDVQAKKNLRGEVEIGITVAPGFQGRGFASEAVGYVLGFLFDTLHKSKVVASVDPENKKSMSLMAGIGFQLEGIYKNAVLFRGVWADDAVFEMTNQQWRNAQNIHHNIHQNTD